MGLEGVAERLTVFVGESDQHGHVPLYVEIVQRARTAGLAGATVLQGVEGFGASARLHLARLFALRVDLPVGVVIVDEPARIEAFLAEIEPLVADGLVVRQSVEVVRHGRRG